jgi:SulP family sulfate permease
LRFPRIRYNWRLFAGDLSGGFIAALIAIPYGLALAGMMGLPPVLGLVTSVATAPVTALLGRNPVLIGGTASATVPFIAHAVSLQGIGGAAKVCLAASIFMMIFSVLRLGRHIHKVPQPVVTGFSCGIGAMMFLSQLNTMLGVRAPIDRTSDNLLYQSWLVISRATQAQAGTLTVSLIVIVVAIAVAHFLPRMPAPLIGVVAATFIAIAFQLHQRTVGEIALTVPSAAGFAWSPHDVRSVLPAAFGLAFVSSVNILITSRVVEHFRGRHRHIRRSDADAELGAYGIANVIAGTFGAPMSVGIPARSLASVRSGGTTRLSNLFHAIFIVLMLMLGGSFIAKIPVPALAGVTAYIGLCLLEWSTWRRLPKMRRLDASAFLATAIAVLVVNAVLAVAIGCSFYAVWWAVKKMERPPADVPPEAKEVLQHAASHYAGK